MIQHLENLARLRVDAKEEERLQKDLNQMVEYINILQEADTSGVEAMSHVHPFSGGLREDEVRNGDAREALMASAPQKKNGLYEVKRSI